MPNQQVRFTIFIPTFNRAELLPRAFESIEQQSFKDFEVLIIDDGSSDNSAEIVKNWQTNVDFPVFYHYQENQGKPAAHNHGAQKANGFFFVTLDSDDLLAPDALEILERHWNNIPDEQKPEFAGVEGLCAFLSDGSIAGRRFPEDVIDSNYPEMRHRYKVSGDKKNAIRTEVVREFQYPLFPGETHIRMSVIWSRMAAKYKFRYINEVIQIIEYQPGGLSSNAFWRRIECPLGYRLTYQEILNDTPEYYSAGERFNAMSKYIRYSFHADIPLSQQLSDINNKALFMATLPKAYINFLIDKRKLKSPKRRLKSPSSKASAQSSR